MPNDLPPDEFGQLAAIMVRLDADFRRRHGLPAPRNVWTDIQALEDMKGRSALNQLEVLQSPRAGIGRGVEAVRRVFWKLLKPIFDRQTEVNHEAIAGLQAVMRASERHRTANEELTARIASLEAEVSRLRERRE